MAQSIPAKSERPEIIVRDPATGGEIGRVPLTIPEEVARAVGRAREAQPAWAARCIRERGSVVMKATRIIIKQLQQIGLPISRESGQPVPDAIAMEVIPPHT